MANLKVQGHLLVEDDNHSYGGLRIINTQAATAEASLTFWQAGESTWGLGAGCHAAGDVFTICSRESNRNLLTMQPDTGDTWLYGNLKIRRLDKNTLPTCVPTFIDNNSANGFSYSMLSDLTVGNAVYLDPNPTPKDTGLYYYKGQATIGTSTGNCYEGSSNDINLWSYPKGGTWSDGTHANIQNLRLMWSAGYWTDIFCSPNGADLWTRKVDNNTAYEWKKILDSANYTSYTVTKTGDGASGTWNINISGNAAKIDVTDTTPSSTTNYYLLYSTERGTGQTARANKDLFYYDTGSYSFLNIGSDDQYGGLTLKSGSGSSVYADLIASNVTGHRTIYMPDANGTLLNTGNYATTLDGRYLKLSGGTVSAAIGENNHNGILQIKNTNSYSGTGYHSPLRIMSPNATGSQCIMIGPSNSEKNAGYMAFYNTGTSGSNSNRLSFGLYAVDNILNITAAGNVGINTTSPTTKFAVYQTDTTTSVANFSTAGSYPWIYFKNNYGSTAVALVGYYAGLACISNEATYARIGVTDAGKPQFWTNTTSGKYELIVGNGYLNNGPIKLTTGAGINSASNNYISAGRGYSTGSGLYGIKLVATEQSDAISGIGQDCLGKAYELSICAALSTAGSGYITFCGHKIASPTTYTELGFFDGAGNFKYNGGLVAVSGKGCGPTLPSASYYGQIFFLTSVNIQ